MPRERESLSPAFASSLKDENENANAIEDSYHPSTVSNPSDHQNPSATFRLSEISPYQHQKKSPQIDTYRNSTQMHAMSRRQSEANLQHHVMSTRPRLSSNNNFSTTNAAGEDTSTSTSTLRPQQPQQVPTSQPQPQPPENFFIRGSILDRDIEIVKAANATNEKKTSYRGRIRTWPGICLLFLIFLIGATGVTYFAIKHRNTRQGRFKDLAKDEFNRRKIKGGKGTNDTSIGGELISDDGIIGNPKKYPESTCELPNYLSKNGKIYAVSKNGTEVPISIKGTNWFGMEGSQSIPFGLWDNSNNGTSAYQIALFLAQNKFNAVRFPICIQSLLNNVVPNVKLINRQENRAISVKNYISMLQSIIKVLQYRQIGFLISIHTLTPMISGGLWYNEDISEDDFLYAIDMLTKSLCSMEYWNVIGIDLKNEPYQASWGDGSSRDFRNGAQRIAARMHTQCRNWLGFVEGINGNHRVNIQGETFTYYDWYGGGLQGVKNNPLDFSIAEKLVWAPHYYTPAVYPQSYLYNGGVKGPGDTLQGYTELDDDTLRIRIRETIEDMFGYLSSETGPAMLLGEFGGLYTTDAHPMKTTQRCTDFTIEIMSQGKGWAGGFMWSLNPESKYQYNPASVGSQTATFEEGLLSIDWLSVNEPYLEALTKLDSMEDLKPFPCFPTS